MKQVDGAWLAAAIDGEGSICIGKNKCILLVNTVEDFVVNAKEMCGGCGTISSREPAKKHYKILYRWTVTGRSDLRKILTAILPYLIIKVDKAKELLLWTFEVGLKPRNHLKGNRGDSKGHKKAALSAKNHRAKGWRGDSKNHSRAAKGFSKC